MHRSKLFAKNRSVSNYAGMKHLTLILAFIIPSLAAAEDRFFHDDNLTRDDLKKIEVNVELADNATGACWTNLKESREYAEEKLRTFGITVSDTEYMSTKIEHYWLILSVSAQRLYTDQSGSCLGAYYFTLKAWSHINGKDHIAELGSWKSGAFLSSSETFNKPVMLGLEKMFASFPEK